MNYSQSSQDSQGSSDQDIRLAEERAKQLEDDLEDILPPGFHLSHEGVFFHPEAKEGKNKIPRPPIWICSPLRIVARTRDSSGNNHGRLLEFTDTDGLLHQWIMPMEKLAGNGTEYRAYLLAHGLLINTASNQAQPLLTLYIQQTSPKKTVRCASRTGWNQDCSAFVFHDATIGQNTSEELIFQDSFEDISRTSCKGTLEDAQRLSKLCEGNSRLLFAQSVAFAAPLLRLIGGESGVIHFRGTSSSGKTTCLAVATSVWGGSESILQWRATANGLEGTAAAHNDCPLFLDEIGQADPKDVGPVAYMLANGVGKTRANKLGLSRQPASWKTIVFSTGEIGLAESMQMAKMKMRAGQEVRFLEIPVDTKKHGCFENLHGFQDGKAFADHLKELCYQSHGESSREYLRRLITRKPWVEGRIREIIQEFCEYRTPKGASEQVKRVVTRFALIAAAGEIATALGITGWKEDTAQYAAAACLEAWLEARGGIGLREERQALDQVRHFFELHGESRFSPWQRGDNEHSKTIHRAGFIGGPFPYIVFPEVFRREICEGLDMKIVIQACIKEGWLIPDSKDCPTRPVRFPGATKSSRAYCFRNFVQGDSDGSAMETTRDDKVVALQVAGDSVSL